MARVFISHASADLPVAVEVWEWLCAEGHELFLDRDLGAGLRVGEAWKQQLYAELRAADAVVCLVSAAFVESKWCAAEVGIADSVGCRLIPVKIDSMSVHPLMETLQYADYHTDRRRAQAELVAAVRRVDTRGGRWREGRNPSPETTSRLLTSVAATHHVQVGILTDAAAVRDVVFAPNGKLLASGSGDLHDVQTKGTVRLWDVSDPAAPRPLGQPLTGGSGSVAFSPDGKMLAGADGNEVRLWDVTEPTAPHPFGQSLAGHTDSVSSVVYSPDGRILASAGNDGTVRLWDATPILELRADPVRVACSLSRTGLTPREWKQYVSGFPYRETRAHR